MVDTMKDDIGRLLMIGFEGEVLSPDVRDLLLEIRPGGIILFRRNVRGGPRQVARLVRECRDLARKEFGRNLFVAIDQEGGPVHRLEAPFSVLPSQRDMARTLSENEVRDLGRISGRELAAAGINVNLAPVMDLSVDAQAIFMAERSFGSDPEKTAAYGQALIDGHGDYNVLTCVKHFPGIGDTRLDPHEELPTVDHSLERLRRLEWYPFKAAIDKGVAAVMTSHVNFPELDPEQPVTFSKKIITGHLRDELGFNGLILTDDLEMGAVVKNYHLGPAAVSSFLAGADLLLVCRQADLIRAAFQGLVGAVEQGEITWDRIHESLLRHEAALARTSRAVRETWQAMFPGA
jgi:beta-N-acetylhexosaminidase